MKYRIVTNGERYEIEYRRWWWPFWFRHEPGIRRITPIDWSKYRFESIEDAKQMIADLKENDKKKKWRVVEI